LYHRADYYDAGYDHSIASGMTFSVENYIGEKDGNESVKLEQQALVTETANRFVSQFPFDVGESEKPVKYYN
jgi:hypothetical protein